MSTPRLRAGGRPSKGKRRVLTTRISVEDAARLEAYSLQTEVSMSELIEQWITPHIRDLKVDESRTQETLDVKTA